MRYFLGFDLDGQDKLAVERWRDTALPLFDTPIPARNFHITSVFLGQLDSHKLDQLTQQIDQQEFRSFTLTLDQLGYFSKPKVLWLGCSEIASSALHINKVLTELANQTGLGLPKGDYIPHVSLVRKLSYNPPAALFDVNIKCKFKQLHLFESVSSPSGVSYPIRCSWDLLPVFSKSV